MKIRIVIVSTCIIIMLTFLINIGIKDRYTFKQDGITYALNLNGTRTNSFPAKGLYQVAVSCTNAKGKWNYDAWKLYIDSITGDVSCDIDFTTITKTYLNNKIKDLAGTTQGDGQLVNENGYRYEGQNPNNFIWFNNELWRIIGVFDSASHGQSGENLVKIIREKSIGGLAWDTDNSSGENNWVNSNLKNLLNGAYYNAEDGTNTSYCYGYGTTARSKCDYRYIGIQDEYRSMIKNVTWYLGGLSNNSNSSIYYGTSVANYYNFERGTSRYGSNPTSATGYIGLMYPSDYGYAVLATDCARNTRLDQYGNCTLNNWLYVQSYEWNITPYSSDGSTVFFIGEGIVTSNSARVGHLVRPTLYLDSSVYVLDGDGSSIDPYIIAM